MKFGVVVFPGSNCDADAYHAFKDALGQPTTYLWHKDHDLRGVDCVILPGGFSYGDYLRSGAIARFSPLMREVREFAGKGGLVLGICNGFQVLLELNLLPGAMLRNKRLKFLCQYVTIRVENDKTPFTRKGTKGRVLRIPIAHFDGNWYAPLETVKEVEGNGQVVFRYCDSEGRLTEESNINGSLNAVAGLMNKEGNVMGMMPHPERAVESILGSEDGLVVLHSLLENIS
ncbi:MAG: phosphoribosylformylglycinamidine synthase subunit PurQ [Candidatus Aminicenantes bacterium]|nr:phosphoribosylformylglycinamidine synthase subunit PurQ [Candidatus Aminicenantes bacterium]